MNLGHHYPFSGTGLPPDTDAAHGTGRSLVGRFTELTNQTDRRAAHRERRARLAWRTLQSGTLHPDAAAGLRRDFAPEFARFEQEAKTTDSRPQTTDQP